MQISGEGWYKDFAGAQGGQVTEKERPGDGICAIKFTGPGHEHWLAVNEVA